MLEIYQIQAADCRNVYSFSGDTIVGCLLGMSKIPIQDDLFKIGPLIVAV